MKCESIVRKYKFTQVAFQFSKSACAKIWRVNLGVSTSFSPYIRNSKFMSYVRRFVLKMTFFLRVFKSFLLSLPTTKTFSCFLQQCLYNISKELASLEMAL